MLARMQDSGGELAEITRLARELQRPLDLETLLDLIVNSAATVVQASRASLRLLDPTRTRLVALCRTGEPLHMDPDMEYGMGEGLVGWIAENNRSIRTGDAQGDPRFKEREDRMEPLVSLLGVPIMSGNVGLGVLAAIHHLPDHFTERHESLLTLLACMCAPYIEIRRLAHLTTTDPLTSTLNRRGLDLTLPEGRVSEPGSSLPISLVMVDIDNFKRINDEYGHVVGDQVLREVARVLAGTLGAGDAVVRYGGDEFLLILPGVHLSGAGRLAEDARRTLQASSFDFHTVHVPVTASFGVAEKRPGEGRATLIHRADQAMYEAKRDGRNRVVLAG